MSSVFQKFKPFNLCSPTISSPTILFLKNYTPSRVSFSDDLSNEKPQGKRQKYESAMRKLWENTNDSRQALVEVESVYKVLPKAHKYIPKTDIPIPRFIWKENDWLDGFPGSPEEARVDVLTYLEQKHCYERLKKMKFKEFCVGSFVAVTYADKYASVGMNSFRGICIYQSHWQNTLGASFTLRNVIDNEAVEINFPLYSPLIHNIEVLKHQRFNEHQLKYLRDYPPAFSYVSEKMKAQPYTEEPELFEFNEEHKKRIERWFARYYQNRQR